MIIKCDENMEGVRLDRFLRKKLKDTALNTIFEYIRKGKVKINGKKKKENYRYDKQSHNKNKYMSI